MNIARIETKMCFTARRDYVLIKLRASLDRLKEQAALSKYKLQIEPSRVESAASAGMRKEGNTWIWRPIEIRDKFKICKYQPFDFFFATYKDDFDTNTRESKNLRLNDMWKRFKNGSIFRGADRIKLLKYAIETPKSKGGAGISLAKLKRANCIQSYFPIHDYDELFQVQQQWIKFWQLPNAQPFDDIAAYFGERIALYFVWVAHYTTWLAYAALAGVIAWIWTAAEATSNSIGVALFALFATIWATLFSNAWRRYQSQFALRWGTVNLNSFEYERLEFIESKKGTIIVPSPITGRPMRWIRPAIKRNLFIRAYIIIILLVATVIALVTAQFISKAKLNQQTKYQHGAWKLFVPTLFGAFTAAQIFAMNKIYDAIARKLNDMENHRTQSEYDDALAVKTILFQFVNSYSSLVFIAFIKPFIGVPCIGGRSDSDCIAELSAQLGSILGFGLIVSNLEEIGIPALQNYMALDAAAVVQEDDATKNISMRRKHHDSNDSDSDDDYHGNGPVEAYVTLTAIEEQFLMQQYTIEEKLFKDYTELVIQYGYATLFSAAFPLAPLLAMINNYVELRVDAWKLCQQCKRVEPVAAETIGTWEYVIELMSLISVQTNALLICFTGLFFNQLAIVHRLALFLLFEHLILGLKLFLNEYTSSTDPHVDMQLQRQAFLYSKIFLNIPDEPDTAATGGLRKILSFDTPEIMSPDFTVHAYDDNLKREADEMRRAFIVATPGVDRGVV
uniref:Anoctamin transmembrane domain-containing protein n=1 Tax=Aureoumbra lagunensis TaxID=44058 RepID=A0A7S3JMU0_9STRA